MSLNWMAMPDPGSMRTTKPEACSLPSSIEKITFNLEPAGMSMLVST